MKRKLYIISVLLMIFGGALYYFNFDALGCALILLGSSIYILTYFGTRGNKPKSQSHWSDYAVTPWDSSDCSS